MKPPSSLSDMPPQQAESSANMPLRHADICAALRGEVADGTYGVGMRFPSELDLQVRFGVGRHTAREALRTLTEEGYIGRKQRQGTFVVAAQPNSRFVQGLGTLDNLMDFGAESRLDIRSFGYVRLRDPTLCQWLRLPSDERWLRIAGVRVHRQSHQPLCWSEFFIPPRYPVARESLEGLDRPIHDFMARTHGFEIGHVEQEIGAAAIPARIAEPLQAAANSLHW